jgi:hypothetical protein
MGGSCGNTENMTINENEHNLQANNQNNGANKKNIPKKGEPGKKTANNKESEKFKDMEEYGNCIKIIIDTDIYSGESVKKMKAYKCSLPYDELQKFRNEFWGNFLITKLQKKTVTVGFGRLFARAVKLMEKLLIKSL